MQCLIIAAGQGHRLQSKGPLKPLIPVLDIPLIKRIIQLCQKEGVSDFFVVTGYQHQTLENYLIQLAAELNVTIKTVFNPGWEKENGLSVVTVENIIQAPFLLLMADHLFDPQNLRKVMSQAIAADEIILAVDENLDNPMVDMDDVTRVHQNNNRIVKIGKNLERYNCFDTGMFLCSKAIFSAIRKSAEQTGNTTLSGGINFLTDRKKARTITIEGFWIDVDEPGMLKKAEQYYANLKSL